MGLKIRDGFEIFFSRKKEKNVEERKDVESIRFIITNIPIESCVLNEYLLSNPYPNPFSPYTNINFTTPSCGRLL